MAVKTLADIMALNFGYLLGTDLLNFCPQQYLIKQESMENGFCAYHVNIAYQEMIGMLSSKCDLVAEYLKRKVTTPTPSDPRSQQVVKLTSLSAIRNIVSSTIGIPENMAKNFDWLDKTLLAIRNGQVSLYSVSVAADDALSEAVLIEQSFLTLG
jgi:hypothetical protein